MIQTSKRMWRQCKWSLIFYFSLFSSSSFSQIERSDYPQNYFRSPLNIPLILAGNFGELRSNHFHAGIDIKTKGVVGHKVVTAADGFVSRIKIQERGYGKVIYVTHPNGYTTVYAHLKSFSEKITKEVRAVQYLKESYTFDQYYDSTQIKLVKGEVLGLSGNSGGSGGPHLHFEIRETESEIPVNPLLFNFPIIDNIPPRVKGVVIYPLSPNATVNGKRRTLFTKAVKQGKGYIVNLPIQVSGQVGIGLQTNDYLNKANNRCGVYDILMEVDGRKKYQYKTEKISFDESRYINAHCDYAYKKKTGKWIHKIYTSPNNQLSLYPLMVDNGVITTSKDSVHQVKINLTDVHQNSTFLKLQLKGVASPVAILKEVDSTVVKSFCYASENEYSTSDFRIYHPKESFYDDLEFRYKKENQGTVYSNVHVVHSYETPMHETATMSIKCKITPANPDKIVVARKQRKKTSYLTGNYINGWVNYKSRYFGKFWIDQDTIAPKIKSVNLFNGKNIGAQQNLVFKIWDDKSGITVYRGQINGVWVLFEYDYKRRRLAHRINPKFLQKGTNTLALLIKDAVGNSTIYKCDFIYVPSK